MLKRIAFIGLLFIPWLAGYGQNPQSNGPLFAANAKYTNGIAPGYAPTSGSGLNLNVGPGTVDCNGTLTPYVGGSFTLSANATNYLYLNTSASCAPAVKTSAFNASDIPIAVVLTGGSSITSVTDDRTPFVYIALASNTATTNGNNAFTGTNTVPTQSANDNSTKVASTAYADRSAQNAVAAIVPSSTEETVTPASGAVTLNSSVSQHTITLAANITTLTLGSLTGSAVECTSFVHDATANTYAVTWPANMRGAFQPGSTASKVSTQCFRYLPSQTAWFATSQGDINE